MLLEEGQHVTDGSMPVVGGYIHLETVAGRQNGRLFDIGQLTQLRNLESVRTRTRMGNTGLGSEGWVLDANAALEMVNECR